MISASEALTRLRDGNRRFVSGMRGSQPLLGSDRRAELTRNPQPFAIILGCSDARVPAEIVFDQGLGDLFVIRVAGNIVAPSQVGSVEFAAERYQAKLAVVLGHSDCGAVGATLDELRNDTHHSGSLRSIVDRIRPAIAELVRSGPAEGLGDRAVRANVRASANHLRHGSPIVERLSHEAGLRVVGAHYSVETGVVEFFDGMDGVPTDG